VVETITIVTVIAAVWGLSKLGDWADGKGWFLVALALAVLGMWFFSGARQAMIDSDTPHSGPLPLYTGDSQP
jgi:hypothetical protein